MEFYRKVAYGDDWYLRGQLDNIISISIMLYLIRHGYPMDCLFVTREEYMMSHPQIIEYLARYDAGNRCRMIDLDIDVADMKPEYILTDGYITLPYTSHNMKLDRKIIDEIEAFAEFKGIPVTRFERVALVQSGKYLQTDPPNKKIVYMGLPMLAYHSPQETMSWKTVENAIILLCGLLQEESESKAIATITTADTRRRHE